MGQALHTDTFNASLLLAELTKRISDAREKIELDHPGLTEKMVTQLYLIQDTLSDVESQTRQMARTLLDACAVPTVETPNESV